MRFGECWTIPPFGSTPRIITSPLFPKIQTFRNAAFSTVSRPNSFGFERRTVPAGKLRISCDQPSQPLSGSSKRTKNRVWLLVFILKLPAHPNRNPFGGWATPYCAFEFPGSIKGDVKKKHFPLRIRGWGVSDIQPLTAATTTVSERCWAHWILGFLNHLVCPRPGRAAPIKALRDTR